MVFTCEKLVAFIIISVCSILPRFLIFNAIAIYTKVNIVNRNIKNIVQEYLYLAWYTKM